MTLTLADFKWFCSSMCADVIPFIEGENRLAACHFVIERIQSTHFRDWPNHYKLFNLGIHPNLGPDPFRVVLEYVDGLRQLGHEECNDRYFFDACEIFQEVIARRKRYQLFDPYADFLADRQLPMEDLDHAARLALDQPNWARVANSIVPTSGTLNIGPAGDPETCFRTQTLAASVDLFFDHVINPDDSDQFQQSKARIWYIPLPNGDWQDLSNWSIDRTRQLHLDESNARFTFIKTPAKIDLEFLQFGQLNRHSIDLTLAGRIHHRVPGLAALPDNRIRWTVNIAFQREELDQIQATYQGNQRV